MDVLWWSLGSLVLGYAVGSIPFAVLIARAHGVDILKAGSGNPGATNVKRVLGSGPGNLCFALDFLKGCLPALWPLWIVADPTWPMIAGMVGALLGHSFSLFLGFRGGKGVATSMGGLLAVMPWVLAIGLLLWVATFYISRFVSLASIVFAVSLPLSTLALWPWLGEAGPKLGLALVLAMLVVVRHRSNIQKLLAGTEHRWEKKPKA